VGGSLVFDATASCSNRPVTDGPAACREEVRTVPAVSVEGVRKSFGSTQALAGVDLEVGRGEIVGLLGPNGAGKTTLVRVLATLLPPDGGRANVLGLDVVEQAAQVRQRIGLTGQQAAVDEILTGRENLRLFGELFHLSVAEARRRADELLERFDLVEAADRTARTYSGGMRRRLDLASSLLVRPELLFLDEPTTGLDPRSRNAIWDVTRELVDEGTTLLLTTQYLEEADQLADRIVVIDHGRIIAEGTGDDLKEQVGGQVVEILLANGDDRRLALRALGDAGHPIGEVRVHVGVDGDDALRQVSRVAAALDGAGIGVRDLGLRRPTLDDVFLQLTGSPPPDDDIASNGHGASQ
jgi:daunorubicin resistance ABC transporter ATP-binding subunit